MAQDHEIRAWLGDQWDEATTRSLIEQIHTAGTDDEEVWEAICRRQDGATIESLREEAELARRHLRGLIRVEYAEDSSHGRKVELAERAQISRPTLDRWLAGGDD